MSATFLVTGFEPFAEHLTNPSWDALELLQPSWPRSIPRFDPPLIEARRLPVDYAAAHRALHAAIDELEPRAVLCTGLARGDIFRIERRARRPVALAAEAGAKESRGRWPWQELRAALDGAGVTCVDSEDAGQYVCESTYWSLLNYAGPAPAPEFAAFLHVPLVSARCPLELIARSVGLVVEARVQAMAGSLLLPDRE